MNVFMCLLYIVSVRLTVCCFSRVVVRVGCLEFVRG